MRGGVVGGRDDLPLLEGQDKAVFLAVAVVVDRDARSAAVGVLTAQDAGVCAQAAEIQRVAGVEVEDGAQALRALCVTAGDQNEGVVAAATEAGGAAFKNQRVVAFRAGDDADAAAGAGFADGDG